MDQIALSPPTPDAEQPKAVEPGDGIGSSYKEYRPLYDHFNLRVEGARHDKALEAIWEYAKAQSPGKDKDSILFEVMKLNNKLGSPNIGMRPYAKLENYVSVWKRFRQAEDQLKQLENL